MKNVYWVIKIRTCTLHPSDLLCRIGVSRLYHSISIIIIIHSCVYCWVKFISCSCSHFAFSPWSYGKVSHFCTACYSWHMWYDTDASIDNYERYVVSDCSAIKVLVSWKHTVQESCCCTKSGTNHTTTKLQTRYAIGWPLRPWWTTRVHQSMV